MTDDGLDFARSTIIIFVGMTIGTGSEFLSRFIAARALLPDQYGIVVLGFTVLNISTLLALAGASTGLARNLEGEEEEDRLFTGTVIVIMGLAVLVALGLFVFRPVLGSLLNEPRFDSTVVIFIIGIPFFVFVKLVVAGFRGIGSPVGKVVVQNVFTEGGRALLIGIGAYMGASLFEMSIFWVAPTVVASVVGMLMLSRVAHLLTTSIDLRYASDYVKPLLLFSLPLMVSETIWELMQHTDNILVGYFLSSEDVGIYNAAFTLGKAFLLIPAIFGFMYLPAFTRAFNAEDSDRMTGLYNLTAKWMTFVALPVILVVVFFPKLLIALTYGAEYAEAQLALLFVSLGFFTHAFIGMNGISLIGIGKTTPQVKGTAIAFTLNIILNVLAIPVFGIVGAAAASGFAYMTTNCYWSIKLYGETRIKPLSKPMVIPAVSTIVVYVSAYYLLSSLIADRLTLLAVCILVLAVVHALSIALLGGLQAPEIRFLTRINEDFVVDLSPMIDYLSVAGVDDAPGDRNEP
jgi:O-antigen/teichoic acid export membrane protein